jgi:uncharacterized membrane protein YeaQ/YmgE (transglycosylase-associated protein family)
LNGLQICRLFYSIGITLNRLINSDNILSLVIYIFLGMIITRFLSPIRTPGGFKVTINNLFIWIIVGAITGVIINALLSGMRIGLSGAILIGILGAVLGGWVFNLLEVQILTGVLNTIVAAFLGAVLLLLVFSVIRRT